MSFRKVENGFWRCVEVERKKGNGSSPPYGHRAFNCLNLSYYFLEQCEGTQSISEYISMFPKLPTENTSENKDVLSKIEDLQ